VIILTESKTQYTQLKGVIRMEENKERLERIKSDFSIFDWLIELAEKRIESNLGYCIVRELVKNNKRYLWGFLKEGIALLLFE
jgi:hypothetical protein